MFVHFRDQLIADGRVPLFVIIPGPSDVKDYNHGLPPQYASLITHLKARGIPHLDFLLALLSNHQADLSIDAIFVDAYYQSHANRGLAEEIIKTLRQP